MFKFDDEKMADTCIQNKIQRIKNSIELCIRKKKLHDAITLLECLCNVLYVYNQQFTDDFIENCIYTIISEIELSSDYKTNKSYDIVFYDGFGLDSRGLARIYLSALLALKYNVLYIVDISKKGKQPEIESLIKNSGCGILYLESHNRVERIKMISDSLTSLGAAHAFFYSHPSDVSGIMGFAHSKRKVKRYLIDLADNTYWIGSTVCDYYIEFRDLGANISSQYRKIERDKIIKLPMYPIINEDMPFDGFPFLKEKEEIIVIFSGGALYKTFDTGSGLFYQIISDCLEYNSNVLFWYAGYGDDSHLKEISKKYPGRVFFTEERKDLYQILQHVDIFLNTYPISGGLMMQYAALAGLAPLTLVNSVDDKGILINQEELGIEFYSYEELISELRHMIADKKYRIQKNKSIKQSVISEKDFISSLRQIINGQKSEYTINYSQIDVSDFLKMRSELFGKSGIERNIPRNCTKIFLKYHPKMGIDSIFIKLVDKIGL